MRTGDCFNFHAELKERKAIRVKDHSSSVTAIRTNLQREAGRPHRIELLEMEGPQAWKTCPILNYSKQAK